MAKRKQSSMRSPLPDQQVRTVVVGLITIMSDPLFARGVADVRAGRGFPSDYDTWVRDDKPWCYERGRQWAQVTPRYVKLMKDGSVTTEAIDWYLRCHDDIR
jgi:hypothetical protein